MTPFWNLLRHNRNYRYLWLGQIVSEVGDHFNSIAVLSLALHLTGSGLTVGGVMIARTLMALLAGPVAGVALDRLDRRRIMLSSDVVRAVVALGFVLILRYPNQWLLYALNGMLMFASPFFSSGRSAILPKIAGPDLHTANAMTQTELDEFRKRNIVFRDEVWTRAGEFLIAKHRPNFLLFHVPISKR